jgi:protein subunit release factor B
VTRTRVLSITIHDCDVQTFKSGGPGGQNQNKRETGVRVIHRPSGAIGESREQRSQLQNKTTAFRRMAETPKFRLWINRELWTGVKAEDRVREDMAERNLRVELRREGLWEPE